MQAFGGVAGRGLALRGGGKDSESVRASLHTRRSSCFSPTFPPSCLVHARYLARFYFALFNGLYGLCGLLTGSGQASSDETLPVGAVKAAGDFTICN